MSKYRRLSVLVVVVVATSLLGAAPTLAQSSPTRADTPVSSGEIPVPPQTDSATTYWTPERMARAKPVTPVVSATPSEGAASPPAGPSVAIPPAAGKEPSTDGAGTITPLAGALAVPKPYTNLPDRLNGKVVFTKALGGDYVCSATSINSENKSVVWTAGHCVHNGGGGTWHRNWIFVPAYSSSTNGSRPYGTY